jgi:hypothetical protein
MNTAVDTISRQSGRIRRAVSMRLKLGTGSGGGAEVAENKHLNGKPARHLMVNRYRRRSARGRPSSLRSPGSA